MDNNFRDRSDLFDLSFDEEIQGTIKSLAKWARIVAITAFATYGVSLMSVFFTGNSVGDQPDIGIRAEKIATVVSVMVGVAVGVLLNFFLLSFSRKIVAGFDNTNQSQVESAFGNLRTYFLIIGILTIIILAIIVLTVTFVGIFGTR